MKMYYVELQDEVGQVVFQSDEFFETKNKAKEWVYANLSFQNGYHNDLYVITCESKNAKTMDEFWEQGYDDIDSERVY